MIKDIIEKNLVPAKEYIFGFADLQGLLPEKYSGFKYGISIGKRLDDRIVDSLLEGPTLEYFHHYNDVNKQLAELTDRIHNDLSSVNINSLPVIPTISVGSPKYKKYLESLSYDISHKMVATRAGLGWIGKTDLLISKEFGPRLRLVTILLDQNPGSTARPVEKSRCGECDICVVRCPAKAATGLKWDVSVHRDKFFNAFRCREKCGELARQKLNVNERICGLCINVCPVGRIRHKSGIINHIQ
jgi:epoxyqueuosine reductase QueG